jgi:hypothetical protein
VPVNRQSTRSRLLGAFTEDEGCLKPFVIMARETVETKLYENSLTPDRVMHGKQENAFVTETRLPSGEIRRSSPISPRRERADSTTTTASSSWMDQARSQTIGFKMNAYGAESNLSCSPHTRTHQLQPNPQSRKAPGHVSGQRNRGFSPRRDRE